VIGVELLAALDQGGIMVQLGAAVGAGWLGADRVAVENWRKADERNEIVLRQLADAGIGQ
jgi:hypothetical protein